MLCLCWWHISSPGAQLPVHQSRRRLSPAGSQCVEAEGHGADSSLLNISEVEMKTSLLSIARTVPLRLD